ncbi:MAG: hypothetical protein CM1200mP36_03730 [Gammaproteobacteria bacterium]|nr:MAG: hypothetical protein CM1200mP36_03730 [Gammaproteobacteria bacterium]
MNRYPPWVNLLVALVIFGGVLFALPNVFGDDPALQITREDGNPVTEITVSSISATLQQQEIEYLSQTSMNRPSLFVFQTLACSFVQARRWVKCCRFTSSH